MTQSANTTEIKQCLSLLMQGVDLSAEQMQLVIKSMMLGELEPALAGGVLIALRAKGESITEIRAAVEVMRELVTPVKISNEHLVDIVGTGGDNHRTFNISTASMFAAAAAGVPIAKHGNRSVSSSSGSADLLEAAGAKLAISADRVSEIIQELNVGFMFAPLHHTLMANITPIRQALGTRTIFNVMGPLANPANAKNQLVGVFEENLLSIYVNVLKELGARKVWVVHSVDGLDEISIASPTHVMQLNAGDISSFDINPKDYGIHHADLDALRVDNPTQSLEVIQQVFSGVKGAPYDIVSLNAAAAVFLAGRSDSFEEGLDMARSVLDNGKAKQILARFVEATNS